LAAILPGDGLLSEEGCTDAPTQRHGWIVDPLDGTTNFSVGLPIWAISMARLQDGQPLEAIIDVPPLRERYVAVRGQGVWRNGEPLQPPGGPRHRCNCASLCTRSLPVLQKVPGRFPAKTRMLGVASLNLLGVGLGTMLAALEATPKIWDLAAVWLILEELGCVIRPLADHPFPMTPGAPLGEASYPLMAACDEEHYQRFLPWGQALVS
jgi:myo-inositol-1(or 4)-monophosphatase